MTNIVGARGTRRRRLLHLAVVALVLAVPMVPPAGPFRASAAPSPPAGGFFSTLGPGSSLPSDAQCASRISRSPWEPRPENAAANQTAPASISLPGFTPEDGGVDIRARGLANRVSGNFTGTTDEIIQWAACKWGFSDETVRAQAVAESTWYQSTAGDQTGFLTGCQAGYVVPCPQSFGLLQVKATVWRNTFPLSRDSTAFNVDYALMVRRMCFEGWVNWLYAHPGSNATYGAGDEWGCIGFWYSGTWYGEGTQSYIDGVRQHAAAKPWRTWPDRSGAPLGVGAVTLTAPAAAAPGAPMTVRWSAPGGGTAPRDWIGLFRTGAPATSYGEWHYTGGASSGSMSFTAPAAGTYEFRYLVNDSYNAVATSAPLTVASAPAPTVGLIVLTTPPAATAGTRLTVSWSAPTGATAPRDWIGLFRPGAPATSYGEWHYTGGASSGSMSFTAPAAGTYEFRYLVNDSYNTVSTSAPMVVA